MEQPLLELFHSYTSLPRPKVGEGCALLSAVTTLGGSHLSLVLSWGLGLSFILHVTDNGITTPRGGGDSGVRTLGCSQDEADGQEGPGDSSILQPVSDLQLTPSLPSVHRSSACFLLV